MLQLKEKFNVNKLHYLLQNKDDLKDIEFTDGINFESLKTYLESSRNGVKTVIYEQKNGTGRWYAKGVSMQNMPREIRHTIAKDLYTDVDMVNAHPVILEHLCNVFNLAIPALRNYNKNRGELLGDLTIQTNISNSYAKRLILILINGGELIIDPLPKWMKEIKQEIKTIHSFFYKTKEFEAFMRSTKKEVNVIGSYMSHMLSDFECKILMNMWESLDKNNECVLCHDGIMIPPGCKFNIKDMERSILESYGIIIELKVKEMDDAIAIPDDIPEYKDYTIPNQFDYDDPYTYADFSKSVGDGGFREREFESYEELSLIISKIYPRVIARIETGDGLYIKKTSFGHDMTKKLGSTDFAMKYSDSKSKKKLIKIKLSDFLSTQSGFGSKCIKLDNTGVTSFNICPQLKCKYVEVSEKAHESLELMKSFIFTNLADSSQIAFDYIISWMALMFQRLNETNGIALVFIGNEGTGKGTIYSFLRHILGAGLCVSDTGISGLLEKHSTMAEGKRLVVLNELATTKDNFMSDFDKLKSFITDETIRVNPKGLPAYEIDNISNFMIFSNNERCLRLGGTDRRYAVFNTVDVGGPTTSHAYFDTLRAKCFNQLCYEAFYSYLMDYKCVDIKKIPDTKLRLTLKEVSRSPLDIYKDSILSGEECLDITTSEKLEIKASEFYERFSAWCTTNGYSRYNNTLFGMYMVKFFPKKRKNAGVFYALHKDPDDEQKDD
jgi:hypothetical protein